MTYKFPVVHPRSKIGRAYEVIDSLSGGKSTDDTPFSVRQIIRSIESAYARAVREDVIYKQSSGETISEQLFTDIFCDKMELFHKDDCNCQSETCLARRVELPVLIQYKGSPLIKDVYVGDVQAKYAFSKESALSITKGRPFINPAPAYYLSGGFMYIQLPPKMARVCTVSYSAVMEVLPSKGSCDDIWSEYPMIDYLWDSVKNQIRSGDGNAVLNTLQISDKVNNGSSINANV